MGVGGKDHGGGTAPDARTDPRHGDPRWSAAIDALSAGQAVGERQRRYWRRQEDREATTMVGLLVTLAESGREVGLHLDHGRRFVGHISATGTDVVTLRCGDGRTVVISLPRVTSIRPLGTTEQTGDRPGAVSVRFAEAVAQLCVDEPEVAVHVNHGEPVRGRLRWCGDDVCCIVVGTGRLPTYVPLAAIAAVAVTQ